MNWVKLNRTEVLVPPIETEFCVDFEKRGLSFPKLQNKQVLIEKLMKSLSNNEKCLTESVKIRSPELLYSGSCSSSSARKSEVDFRPTKQLFFSDFV